MVLGKRNTGALHKACTPILTQGLASTGIVRGRHEVDQLQIFESDERLTCIIQISEILEIVERVYLYPIIAHFPTILNDSMMINDLQYRCKSLLTSLLPQDLISLNLKSFFQHQASFLNTLGPPKTWKSNQALEIISKVGLGGLEAKKILGEVMFHALIKRVESETEGELASASDNHEGLKKWIGAQFQNVTGESLVILQDDDEYGRTVEIFSPADVERWLEMALGQRGRILTAQLFDIVIQWDESGGALEELRDFVTTAAGRNHVVDGFNLSTAHRLLHPGASTIEILQVYINVIRVFTTLDPKGVLLDRVSRPIRRYLRERDDTVSIVIAGLLADPELKDEDPLVNGEALIELTREIDKSSAVTNHDGDDADLDFDDMEWTPDPVDAGPDFKRSKTIDIITSLLSLFESRNVVVTEFQKALGERLLRIDFDFDREVRVLELLKLRIGEANLQACEVMLRDIIDSRRVDSSVQKSIADAAADKYTLPPLHARILSHLFWPNLNAETFNVPAPIKALETVYSNCFEKIKASRKLTWLPSLGQVIVSLDLEDRTVTELVPTWQAAVINAFQPDPDRPGLGITTEEPVTRSLTYLTSYLEMSESLVLNALTFWISKLVLTHPSPQTDPPTFTVLETLDIDDAAAAAAATQKGLLPPTTTTNTTTIVESSSAAAVAAMPSDHDVALEKMQLYKQYAIGMLTNGGPMSLVQIVTMLKMTVPGGFPFGNEDLKDVLEGEVRGGGLGFGGGLYRIVKPGTG